MEVKKVTLIDPEFDGMMVQATVGGFEFSEYVKIEDGQAVVERIDSNIKLNQQDRLEALYKSTLKEGETLVIFGSDDYRYRDAEGELNPIDIDDLFDSLEEAAQEVFKSLYIEAYDKAIIAIISDFDPAADKESGSPWCLADIDYVNASTVSEIEEQAKAHAEEHAPEIAKLLADDFQNKDGNKRVVIVNDGKYDIYDLQNFYDIFGRVREDAHDWDAIQTAYLEADDTMTFDDFEKLIEQNEPVKSLDDLYIKMLKDHPSVMDKYENAWSSDLPNFGGEEPDDTEGVWSWDYTRLIVGSSARDLEIITREEFNERRQ